MIHEILPINNYTGNNSATTFDFDFYIENANQLKVYHFDSLKIKRELTLNVDYSINELRNPNGSYITFPLQGSSYSVLQETENLSLNLSLPISQETQYNNSSLLNLEALEYSFDYLTRLIQILSRKLTLCVSVDECSDTSPQELLENINSKAAQVSTLANSVSGYYNNISEIDGRFNTYSSQLSSITNKAEKDLSNLTSAGKKVLDGQWVVSGNTITSGRNAQTSTDLTYNLTSYLPADGQSYEVLFSMLGSTAATTGSYQYGLLTTDIITQTARIYIARTTAAVGVTGAGTVILPVGTGRTVTVMAHSSNTGTFNLYALGYRRIGTNS